jgi:hypothetical protein
MFAHGLDVRGHLGTFGYDGGVDISDRPLMLLEQVACIAEEYTARLIFPAWIVRWEVLSDIS